MGRQKHRQRLSITRCDDGLADEVAEVEGVHFWQMEYTFLAKEPNEESERQ